MTKERIIEQLLENHAALLTTVNILPNEILNHSVNSKWTPAQHCDHITRSIRPLGMLFKLPKWLLRLFFGTSNRDSRDYDRVVEKYLDRLRAGGRATGRFIPNQKITFEKQRLLQNGKGMVEKLTRSLSEWSEEEIDIFILPHPLLGKLTVREMMYFSIYHIHHHRELIRRDYGNAVSN
jgi:hypothetical protein